MIKAVFFDVNETILDLGLLKKEFEKQFNDEHIFRYWFTKLLQTSQTVSIVDEYRGFGELAAFVLESISYERGVKLTQENKETILGTFRNLSPYDDVRKSFKILKQNNIRVIPVSNSSLEMMKEQLKYGELLDLVDAYYSVDSVKRYKPFNEIYDYAADHEGLSPENIVMVASHDWDLFGAKKAGFTTAYIKRKEEIFSPAYSQPDIKETNLVELVQRILTIK